MEKKFRSRSFIKKDLRKINTSITIETLSINLGSEENVLELVKHVRKKFASINILINCAGIFMIKSIEKSTIEDFDKSFDFYNQANTLYQKKINVSVKFEKENFHNTKKT